MAVAETSVRHSPESAEVTEAEAREQHWRRVRRRVLVAYCVILALFVLLVGIPTDREGLLLWIVAGLGIRCLGRGWRSFGRVLLDWLPFTAVLVVYDYTRGFADGLGMPIHVREPADADLWMFHGVLPTQWMQQHFYTPGVVHWYDAGVTLVYTSHFVATPVIAAVLWLVNRREWTRFISRVIALAFVGVSIYILYPAAPPWYGARHGVIDPVARLTGRGWTELGLNHAGQVLSKGQAAVNVVAAMPSLHTAYATLIALYFIRRVPWWGRIPLACYPVAMGAALVYSGEHYAVDVFFGWATGAGVVVASAIVERRLVARRRSRAAVAVTASRPLPVAGGPALDGALFEPAAGRVQPARTSAGDRTEANPIEPARGRSDTGAPDAGATANGAATGGATADGVAANGTAHGAADNGVTADPDGVAATPSAGADSGRGGAAEPEPEH